MSKKQRTILFSICASLFLLTSLVVIFYSQGYRFDFKEKRIRQSGAFYFKVIPKSAIVEINNKFTKKTDIFFGAAFIDNLLPRNYSVRITKDGYHPWEKNLEIKEKQVTEAKNIILFPFDLSFQPLFKNVSNFFFSPDERRLIIVENTKEGWELKNYDLKTNIKSYLLKAGDLDDEKAEVSDLEFSSDSKRAFLKIFSGKELKYFLIDLEQEPKTSQFLTSLDFLGKGITKLSFSPKNTQELIFLKEGRLQKVDLIKKEISPVSLSDILTFTFGNDSLYYLEAKGLVYKIDYSFLNKEKINLVNFQMRKNASYNLIALDDFLFLKENDNLYLLNPESKNFEKFFEKNKGLAISPDSQKVVYWSDFEIWVLFLENQKTQPQKAIGDKLFLTRFSDKLNEVFWLNSYYLIFSNADKIKIAEIDDRDQINIIDLSEIKESKLFFNKNDRRIYLLKDGELSISKPLIQ